MTAIVGPNGCGKSNVSDAIRWVLGEQSAKALRGAKMEDCIFNGTQTRKPLGMAEVNITFTNCENTLPTEFHEVTITRRVFRSGEGQYFINKTPCRLKDIQRLFMDTGVGTSSYSFMAQGRIDQILSARPEDRREIFEEASGITKYKSDKREALRKLEHTEANLLRLADVIREVKRQIGSLQRQAGKAQRYKSLREEMRTLDLFAAQSRLKDFEKSRLARETELNSLTEQIRTAHEEVQAADEQNIERRETILNMEREIATVMEAGVHAQSKLDRTQDMIRINTQRIEEYRSLAERDTRELDELNRQLEDRTTMLADLEEKLAAMKVQREEAKLALDECSAAYDSHRRQIDTARQRVQHLRDDSINMEAQASRLHNQLMQIETQERTTLIQRERLTAEKHQITASAEDYRKRTEILKQSLEMLQGGVEEVAERGREIDRRRQETQSAIREAQQHRSSLQSSVAARQATLDLLSDADEVQGDFPGGSRMLLDPANPLQADVAAIKGALAQYISAPESCTRALETALRAILERADRTRCRRAAGRRAPGGLARSSQCPARPRCTPGDGDTGLAADHHDRHHAQPGRSPARDDPAGRVAGASAIPSARRFAGASAIPSARRFLGGNRRWHPDTRERCARVLDERARRHQPAAPQARDRHGPPGNQPPAAGDRRLRRTPA